MCLNLPNQSKDNSKTMESDTMFLFRKGRLSQLEIILLQMSTQLVTCPTTINWNLTMMGPVTALHLSKPAISKLQSLVKI